MLSLPIWLVRGAESGEAGPVTYLAGERSTIPTEGTWGQKNYVGGSGPRPWADRQLRRGAWDRAFIQTREALSNAAYLIRSGAGRQQWPAPPSASPMARRRDLFKHHARPAAGECVRRPTIRLRREQLLCSLPTHADSVAL